MIKSTAKADSVARELKDKLALRGFSVAESKVNGWPKLTIDAVASIKIEAVDMVSKDIFGNDLKAFAPHKVDVAIKSDEVAAIATTAKIMQEVAKLGMKVVIKSNAVLATAEASDGEEIIADVIWPSFGA